MQFQGTAEPPWGLELTTLASTGTPQSTREELLFQMLWIDSGIVRETGTGTLRGTPGMRQSGCSGTTVTLIQVQHNLPYRIKHRTTANKVLNIIPLPYLHVLYVI